MMNINNLNKCFSFEKIYWFGLFALLICMFHNNVLCVDDTYYNFLADAKITMHREYFYGTWIMPVNNFLMYYLPYKLGINLQDWAQYFGAFIEALVFVILFRYYSKFFEFAQISKIMNLFLTSIVFMFIFFLLNFWNFADILIYSGFFRFIIPAVLLIIWCYYLYKRFKFQSFGTVSFIAFLLFSMLTASSSEIVGFMCIISSFILFVYSVLKKKECNKDLAIIFIAILIGFVYLILTKGFQEHFWGKIQNGVFSFETLAINFFPYLKACLKKLFDINGFLLILFFTLIYFNKKVKNSDDEMVFSSSLLAAAIILAFSLIVLGKTHYTGGFWIEHADIYIFLYFLCISGMEVLSINLLNMKSKKFILVCFFILLPLFCFSFIHLRVSINNTRDMTYLRDKMMLYYYRSSQEQDKIFLPYALFVDSYYPIVCLHHPLMYQESRYDNKILSMASNIFNNFDSFVNLYSRKIFPGDIEFIEMYKNSMYINYYPIVYKCKFNGKNLPIEFIDGREAMEIFVNNGGDYSEIKNHKYRFSDLEIKE